MTPLEIRNSTLKLYVLNGILLVTSVFAFCPPHSPSENGCLGYIIEGRTAIATPPKPIEGHIFFHLKILFYVNQFVIRA